ADISTWLKDLLPRTPGAVRSVVLREFHNTCREFYEQSFSWRQTLAPVPLVSGTATYTIPSPNADSEIVAVLGISIDSLPVTPAQRKPITEDNGSSRPRYFYSDGINPD